MVQSDGGLGFQPMGQDGQGEVAVAEVDRAVIFVANYFHLEDFFVEIGQLFGVARKQRQMADARPGHGNALLSVALVQALHIGQPSSHPVRGASYSWRSQVTSKSS